jgi:hypothetical protein
MAAMKAADWVYVMDNATAAQMAAGSAVTMDFQLAEWMEIWTADQTAAV